MGSTQVLVYALHKLFDQGRIPDMPIFVDSLLAVAATEVFRNHPECFDEETVRQFDNEHEDPFGFGRLQYVKDVNDSKNLSGLTYPHITISASGMAPSSAEQYRQSENSPPVCGAMRPRTRWPDGLWMGIGK